MKRRTSCHHRGRAPVGANVRQHMRTLAMFFTAAGLICGFTSASAADLEVRVVRDKQDLFITHPERVATKLIAIAESCSVNSTAYAVSGNAWTRILASDSFVHVVFSNPRRIWLNDRNTQGREERMIQEVLFPLPMDGDPPHIYLKAGKEIVSATKYDPYALRELVLEDDLRLRGLPRYDLLLNLRGKR